MSIKPIGIFDSGIGGTSIFKDIHQLLPSENIIYLADSKNAPYGEKSKTQILELSIKNTELLIDKGCKIIVVACNTATTNSIDILRANYQIPFIGIEPAIKPAALNSKTKAVGILATKGTLASELFHRTTNLYGHGIKVVEREGKGIVQLIEEGKIDTTEMRILLQEYLEPMLEEDIDYLVLGCTHYPYLIPILKKILPKRVSIIDSGYAVAKQTKTVLEKLNLLNSVNDPGRCEFYTNREVSVLKKVLQDKYHVSFLNF